MIKFVPVADKSARQTKTYIDYRIVAPGVTISNETDLTGHDNNDIITGTDKDRKIREYVIPSMLHSEKHRSFICIDTEYRIYNQVKDELLKKGCRVELLDYQNPDNSTINYLPLEDVGYSMMYYPDDSFGSPYYYRDRDVKSIADSIIHVDTEETGLSWDYAASEYLQWAIAYMHRHYSQEFYSFETVKKIINLISSEQFDEMLKRIEIGSYYDSDTLLIKLGHKILDLKNDEKKVHLNIVKRLYDLLDRLMTCELISTDPAKKNFSIPYLGSCSTFLFVNVSANDRSYDNLISTFCVQAYNLLIDLANSIEHYDRLYKPVSIIFNDFASTFSILDFDKIISNTSSLGINTSILVDSVSQIESMYGHEKCDSILNNCDYHINYDDNQISIHRKFESTAP